jgi:hypothetical protein
MVSGGGDAVIRNGIRCAAVVVVVVQGVVQALGSPGRPQCERTSQYQTRINSIRPYTQFLLRFRFYGTIA